MRSASNDADEIRLLVGRINAAWTGCVEEQMKDCFHGQVVIRSLPDFVQRAVGLQACVQSYRDFNERV